MKIDTIGQLLCGREIDVTNGAVVTVTIGMPQPFPDGNDDYFCPFQIVGIGPERVRYGAGVDSLQALIQALRMIGVMLYSSPEGKRGELSWLGQRDLGFPLPDSAVGKVR